MELDDKLVLQAGNTAIPAMTAAMSYRRLETPEAKQKALAAIYDLDKQGYSKLARELLGKLVVSQVAPAFEKTSQSRKELLEQKKRHNNLEKFANITGRIPFPLPSINIGLNFLEENFKKAQEKELEELNRRKREH